MKKIDLKKNALDMEYKFESQKAMGWFTFGTVTWLGVVVALIINKSYELAGGLGFLIIIIATLAFRKRQKHLNKILKKIENLH
jgi:hypothetical protein